MPNIQAPPLFLLALTFTPGLGPVRSRRLISHLGSAAAIFEAAQSDIEQVEGVGSAVARGVVKNRDKALSIADKELRKAEDLGVLVVAQDQPGFPQLLKPLPDCPLVLFIRGELDPEDQFSLGVVGSRRCSQYGLEQAGRFASQLASRGIRIVSGGARGIDTAAHRGALNAGGRTIVVLGCGLSHCYPPENLALYDSIVDGGGAIVSELPCDSPPQGRNFPARNRIISGMSLGVLVVEAGRKSGALITARQAVEEHGREVFALPGRIDSEACAGSLELLKMGGAQMVTEPRDIVQALEMPARHAHAGTHSDRYTPDETKRYEPAAKATIPGGEAGRKIYEVCDESRTLDQIGELTGLDMAAVGQTITLLEISGLVSRSSGRVTRSR
ncbi:MAG: DNA-processing protein DprA [Phycisphaerales bacterium]